MSNIIEIPHVEYNEPHKAYIEIGKNLINIDNVILVEPRFFSDKTQSNYGELSRYIVCFSKDVYTYTNKEGYELISRYINSQTGIVSNEKI